MIRSLVYSVPQAAAVLGVSERTVRREIAAGRLPHQRVRRRVVVPKVALARWVESNTTTGQPS